MSEAETIATLRAQRDEAWSEYDRIRGRLSEAEKLLRRIDWRGHVGDKDHEDIRRLLSGGTQQ